jgi:hypothetical protein
MRPEAQAAPVYPPPSYAPAYPSQYAPQPGYPPPQYAPPPGYPPHYAPAPGSPSPGYSQPQYEQPQALVDNSPVLPATHHPRAFALGLTTLKEHGFGAFLRVRADHVALDIAYGTMPVLLVLQTRSGDTVDVKADMSAVHLDGSLLVFFSDNQKRFQNGLRGGVVYDSIMGPGAMFGWVGDLVWNRFGLGFGAGLQVYTDFNSRVSKHFGIARSSVEDSLGTVQPYVGVNFFWYLG